VLGKRLFIAPAASSAQVNLPTKLPSSNGVGQGAEKGYGAFDMTCLLGDRIDFLNLRDTLLQLKVDVGACLERVDGLLGSVENLAELSLKSCPTCMMDNDLGSQLKSVEASLGGNGLGAGVFASYVGRTKPKSKPKPKPRPKVVFRQKMKLDRGVDPKGVAPAQQSSQAHSISDWSWVRLNVGQSSELGGVDQQEQVCFEPDPKGKAIAQPIFQVLSCSDRLPMRSEAAQSSNLEASTSSGVPLAVPRSSLLSGISLSVGGMVGPAVSSDPVDLMSVVTIDEPIEVMSPARVQPELNLAVRESRVDALAYFFQVSTDLLSAVSEGRARMSRLFGPCAGSGGGGSFAWKGNFSGELVVSGLNGWGCC